MELVTDPPISVKIRKMKERVRWQEPEMVKRGIDQTRMVLDDGQQDNPDFSFIVLGDSGSGSYRGYNPQRRVAELMLEQRDGCRFVLHTGDVIYFVGSSEFYPKNFIEPYREFLVGGENHERIAYDQMVFNLPILPVLGNHDYYDLPLLYGLLAQGTRPLRRLLRSKIDFDIGLHGSHQGDAYARAFLDYLKALPNPADLSAHLDQHYTAKTETGFCLRYEPGQFTRLPNRYYSFRYGGIDFFALDSNTFNAPLPLPATREGDAYRHTLEQRRAEQAQKKQELMNAGMSLSSNPPEQVEEHDDLRTKIEQIDEVIHDIDQQLAANETTVTDTEQLKWLQQGLIKSWNTSEVRGRIIYFHHPPYVTEASKWHQAQTLAIRHRLRQVLDNVAKAVGAQAQDRPLVDLILNGHAHCLDYVRTLDTGHADANLNWIVCGGSGFSLRRQRTEGPELIEGVGGLGSSQTRLVAKSLLYVGRNGHGYQKRRPYSFLRIDVQDGRPPKFTVRPFAAERTQRQWQTQAIKPFVI
ncbi:metallophosphoesterase [Leptolyngbya sp. FACHB-261]|uniref:metallophosphoesterase family protein n=1 Tax=Leptolyngbya sp. FACHB-261 TaxID=2692806 RepID=UPI00168A34CC|nr:metallophosphoesterase [Leptolyngbya sp. FACHB-261]MBD2104402.1 metallophosphoesterase [Leptolyngbya sp. FACHB-261]